MRSCLVGLWLWLWLCWTWVRGIVHTHLKESSVRTVDAQKFDNDLGPRAHPHDLAGGGCRPPPDPSQAASPQRLRRTAMGIVNAMWIVNAMGIVNAMWIVNAI